MIDLTPLDVRNKRGDFRKGLRGYESVEVDTFLEIVAERLEALVRENLQIKERSHALERQVKLQVEREEAVRDALVTAQELRTEIREQARREADKLVEDARTEARRLVAEAEAEVRIRARGAERKADDIARSLAELERGRLRFLRSFRQLLEREMDLVEVEEARMPLEDRAFELDPVAADPGPAVNAGEAWQGAALDEAAPPPTAGDGATGSRSADADRVLPGVNLLPNDGLRSSDTRLFQLEERDDQDPERK